MPDMGKTKYQTRLAADDAEAVDEYVENHNVSQSEAVRRLIRAGLDAEGDDGDDEGTGTVERAAQSGTLITVLLVTILGLQVAMIGGVV